MDIFERINKDEGGPLGQYRARGHGYFTFPKLEGEIAPRMRFNGHEVLCWSLNNYLGLANHPEIRKIDAEAAARWGLAYPMGSRMMSGQTALHERLERELAEFEQKEDAFLFNFGYQGIVSTIDALVNRHDVIVYDSEAHACLIDGCRLHMGKRMVYPHNDIEKCEKTIQRALKVCEETGGGILLITEGVYGMTGALGFLDKIVEDKIDGILCFNDVIAFIVVEALEARGMEAGVHYGIMGFDNVQQMMRMPRFLTTVDVGCYEFAEKGAEVMLDLLSGEETEKPAFRDAHKSFLVQGRSTVVKQ